MSKLEKIVGQCKSSVSKELEALDRLYECNDDDYTLGYQQHDYKLLQQALQRLEAIDKAKPSESLKLVGYLKDYFLNMIPYCDWLNDIEKYILKSQEQEKVLKIIFEKNVDIGLLKRSENWLDYYTRFKHRTGKDTKLTEEEFNLLKRYYDEEKD